jgi:uncharacterized RDD family membrane protein YckC
MAAADQAPEARPLPEEPGHPPGVPGLPGERPLAEPGQRLVARIVDTLLVGLPVVMVVRATVPQTDVDAVAPPAVAGFLLLYEWIQLALWGRTLGKRFAGIEVARQTAPEGVSAGIEASHEDIEGSTELDASTEPSVSAAEPPVSAPGRLGAARSLLRTALYALPIGVRPVPVFGVIAGLFWVGNAGLMYEGGRRQALHDRLAGTIVVKR